jgi:hypothetical protein
MVCIWRVRSSANLSALARAPVLKSVSALNAIKPAMIEEA